MLNELRITQALSSLADAQQKLDRLNTILAPCIMADVEQDVSHAQNLLREYLGNMEKVMAAEHVHPN